MPCISEYPEDALRRAVDELNEATRVACEIIHALREQDLWHLIDMDKRLSKPTLKWIERHDQADDERKRRERVGREHDKERRKVIERLTESERKLLGVK